MEECRFKSRRCLHYFETSVPMIFFYVNKSQNSCSCVYPLCKVILNTTTMMNDIVIHKKEWRNTNNRRYVCAYWVDGVY